MKVVSSNNGANAKRLISEKDVIALASLAGRVMNRGVFESSGTIARRNVGCSRCAAVCASFPCLRVSVRRVRRFVTMVDRTNVDGGVFGAAASWVNGTN